MTMTMTVVVSEATGGGFTLSIPIAGSRIALDRARRPIGSAVRRMDIQFVHDVRTDIECPSSDMATNSQGVRYIEGGLGLEQWIEETGSIVARSASQPAEINYTLGFDIALSDSFNPVFSRSSDGGISPDVSPEDVDSRRVAHRVAVTILPEAPGRRISEPQLLEAARRFLDRIPTN